METTVATTGNNSRAARVWYLVPALYVGGAERRLITIANGLDHERYDVTVWTFFERNPLADELAPEVDLRTLGARAETVDDRDSAVARAASPLEYVRVPLRFARRVRAERPDLVHSFMFYDNQIARVAGAVAPGTTVVTEALGFQNGAGRRYNIVDRLTMPLSDRIVSNSRAGAELFRQHGVSDERLAVVPDGRDVDRFASASADGYREEFGFPAGAPVVGTVGRTVERKGHGDLLNAWPRIFDRHPSARLLIVGDGGERERFEDRARSLDVEWSVRFAGIRQDTPGLLALMSLFVFPSHWEGLPGALMEAMAAGLPIVATDIPGNNELVTDGETGLLVDARDPPALAEATCRLLDHPDEAARLGDAAQDEARRTFSLGAMRTSVERLYAGLDLGSTRATLAD